MPDVSFQSSARVGTRCIVSVLCLLAVVGDTEAHAQQASYALQVEGAPLGAALERLAAEAGLPLVYDPALVAGIEARCAGEQATAEALLRCVLRGTGLTVRRLPSGTYVIEPKAPGEEEPERYTVSGYVEGAATGERLAGANVYAPALDVGTTTNDYGYYSLTLPEGRHRLVYSYVGYAPKVDTLRLHRDTMRIVRLRQQTYALEGVTVEERRIQPLARQVQMSRIRVAPARVKSTPMLLGVNDVLKTLQLLPGVKSGMEGTNGLYVRGGKPGQNLILLDGVPLYNASHLLGFLSVFNPDLVSSVELIKGGFPARYGGRLSSVIDVDLEAGNMKSYLVEGAVGLVSSRLTVQGPIVEGKTSFLLSGRRNYIDLVVRPFLNTEDGKPTAYFYDLNAKVSHTFSPRDRVSLSFYMGGDRFGLEENESSALNSVDIGWGNIVGALGWNHVFSDRLFMNAQLSYSRYRFGIDVLSKDSNPYNPEDTRLYRLAYTSGIRSGAARVDFEYQPSPRHDVRFGAKITAHTFRPGAISYEVSGNQPTLDSAATATIRAQQGMVYVEDDVKITDRLRANVGLHASAFHVEDALYASLQPRLSVRYLLTNDLSLKGSFATMRQYVHLLTHANLGLPTDLWVPATDQLPPQDAWQAAVGLARSFDGFDVSLEAYYKDMGHVIAYEPGAGFTSTAASYEEKVTTGDGWAYGLEVLLRRRVGRTTGWLGYTLAWAGRQFDALNGGEPFPARYDRRHSLSLVLTRRLSSSFEVSLTWVYRTGHAVTIPRARYRLSRTPIYAPDDFTRPRRYYGERNGFRMPAYHRLDLGVNWYIARGQPEHVLSFGVYNAYNHKNATFFYLDETKSGETVARGTAIFPVLPYISYSFSF